MRAHRHFIDKDNINRNSNDKNNMRAHRVTHRHSNDEDSMRPHRHYIDKDNINRNSNDKDNMRAHRHSNDKDSILTKGFCGNKDNMRTHRVSNTEDSVIRTILILRCS